MAGDGPIWRLAPLRIARKRPAKAEFQTFLLSLWSRASLFYCPEPKFTACSEMFETQLLQKMDQKLEQILANQKTIMADLSTLQAAVANEDSVVASAITLIQGLAQQVAALTPTQSAIDALAADIQAKSTALAAAVTANTPATPPASS